MTRTAIASMAAILLAPAPAGGEPPRLADVFGDHMVVQRGVPMRVWGWAAPGIEVRAEMGGHRGAGVADSDGRFVVELAALAAGGPHQLRVATGADATRVDDVLVGDVWIASGQSNMEWPLHDTLGGRAAIADAGAGATLALGPIDDYDRVFVNGVRVGGMGHERPHSPWYQRRVYDVAPGVLRAGDNVVAVRVIDTGGGGGFHGRPEEMRLTRPGADPVPLAGRWRFRVTDDASTRGGFPSWVPASGWIGPESRPGALYNAMIHPLTRFPVRGVIWYQGESNTDRAEQYAELFPTMIASWRRAFGHPRMPFVFVQLANFMARRPVPTESAWAELRAAQAAALDLPATAMAVAIDIGDADDIHPRNKRDVGRRLALGALDVAYGREVVASGPSLASVSFRPGVAVVRLDHAVGLSTDDGRPPRGFALASAGGPFVWAEARIVGSSVELTAAGIATPAAVRYAWADNPDVNLVNRAGLPAVPFRTDDRPGLTAGAR